MAGLPSLSSESGSSGFFLLIHTVTVAESDLVVEAQFLHAFSRDCADARLVAKRLRMRVRPRGGKGHLRRMDVPGLRALMKRNSANVKHHLRAVHVNPQIQSLLPSRPADDGINNNVGIVAVPQNAVQKAPVDKEEKPQQVVQTNTLNNNVNLTQESSPEETARWLRANRFERYMETFGRFSGDDMLRMSRDDLIQICGDADGIRLHNSIHLKSIAPKLKIYVCRDNSTLYNAIFLSAHSKSELAHKLSTMLGLPRDQIRDIYVEGPHSIHVQLNADLLKHVKEETMFALEVIHRHDSGGYVLLLKRSAK